MEKPIIVYVDINECEFLPEIKYSICYYKINGKLFFALKYYNYI